MTTLGTRTTLRIQINPLLVQILTNLMSFNLDYTQLLTVILEFVNDRIYRSISHFGDFFKNYQNYIYIYPTLKLLAFY